MKRKDFLTRMRNRRRGDQLELRTGDRRRAIDWRTLRVELPDDDNVATQDLAVGTVEMLSSGIRLRPSEPCWVRGYRMWQDDEGRGRAEFQYRPVPEDAAPPPGATAVGLDEIWQP
ncbi:MAG: hypothetical protein GKS06_13750 [Acidobacteria bacterium]|nr:hypothetical protein [Acidobacteriota bacterium]